MFEKFLDHLGMSARHFQSTYYHLGPISFTKHIGTLPSEELWTDLQSRLHVNRLWVLRPPYPTWLNGTGPLTVVLYLDEQDLIKEILFEPWYS